MGTRTQHPRSALSLSHAYFADNDRHGCSLECARIGAHLVAGASGLMQHGVRMPLFTALSAPAWPHPLFAQLRLVTSAAHGRESFGPRFLFFFSSISSTGRPSFFSPLVSPAPRLRLGVAGQRSKRRRTRRRRRTTQVSRGRRVESPRSRRTPRPRARARERASIADGLYS